MKLHELTQMVERSNKRVGRGYGSGKGGHNSGRGTKGQKARTKVPAHFVGTSWVWFKRLPFIRGKSRFSPIKTKLTVTVGDLNALKAGEVVNNEALYNAGLITYKNMLSGKVKVVSGGKLEKKLKVVIPASKSAALAIEKAGGSLGESNS